MDQGNFIIYCFVFLIVFALSLLISGLLRSTPKLRLGSSFFAIMFLTYFVKPAMDRFSWHFSDLPGYISSVQESSLMPDITLAVSLAFLSFAIGYAIRGRKRKPDFQKQNDEKYLISKKVWLTIGIFIVLGYLSLLKFNANPLLGVQDIAMRHTAGGSIYTDTTGYFVIANILVGVAAIIIFALTGKVLPTLLVAGPWLLVRLYIGWSRNVIVTFVIALVSVFYIAKYNKKLRYKLSNILIMALLIIMVVVIMPIIQGNRFFFRQHEASSSNIASVLKQQLNNKGELI